MKEARTIFQLNSYADACERGEWLEARIDTAIPDKNPPKPDIRKMLVPLGPVVVFGHPIFLLLIQLQVVIQLVHLRPVVLLL